MDAHKNQTNELEHIAAAVVAAKARVTGEPATAEKLTSVLTKSQPEDLVVPAEFSLTTALSSAYLDLTKATFSAEQTRITVTNGAGAEVKIRIPEGFRVRNEVRGRFGGNLTTVEEGAINPDELPDEAPLIVIDGIAPMAIAEAIIVKTT